MATTLLVVLAVIGALAVLAVVGAVAGLRYLIDLPVGPFSTPKAAASLDVVAIGRALDGTVQMTTGRVPPDVQAKVAGIRREILELLPSTRAFPVGSEDLYVIQRTAVDYLPSTITAYLALPDGYATTHVLQDGKTALQLLREQLQLLEDRLDEITDAVHQQDSDRLVANGRFLEERFGQGGSLALPPNA